MKKLGIVGLASFIFLLLSSITTVILKYTSIESAKMSLIYGVAILALSAVLAIMAKKNLALNCVCFSLSGIALGFCINAWYIFRHFNNPFWALILVCLACVAYLGVFYLFLFIPFVNNHFKTYLWSFLIASLIGYVMLVVLTKTTYVSTFGYYMIIEIAFIFALCKSEGSWKELIRNITLSTYSVLVVAIIIALIMASGDGADGFLDGDLDISSGINSPRRKNNNNSL